MGVFLKNDVGVSRVKILPLEAVEGTLPGGHRGHGALGAVVGKDVVPLGL